MRIKRFVGSDTEQAIRKVRDEFGPEAVILATRAIKRGKGTFGLLGRSLVEITAGIDDARPVLAPALAVEASEPPPAQPPWQGLERLKLAEQSVELIQPLEDRLNDIREIVERALQSKPEPSTRPEEMGEIKAMLRSLIKDQRSVGLAQLPPCLIEWRERLIERGVEERLAGKLVEEINGKLASDKLLDGAYLEGYLQRVIAHLIHTSGPLQAGDGRARVVAFIGATGVGKTTTIAKLAADLSIVQRKRVAMITVDERKGVFEQVKFFAKAISTVSRIAIPAELVSEPEDLGEVLHAYAGYDVIFVDTVGTPHFNEAQLQRLSDFMAVCPDPERYLVLSCPTRDRDLMDMVRRFETVGYEGLVFSKADECSSYGHIFNVLMYCKKPVAYVTTGQRVPEDIELATSEKLAERIVKGRR
ncbi:MAG: flagellar biosynthesis protein FlhF [Nitrospirae bacterium]|nr:flagellar biosynthesis protein FlhF [Nitrospirota bacterium]